MDSPVNEKRPQTTRSTVLRTVSTAEKSDLESGDTPEPELEKVQVVPRAGGNIREKDLEEYIETTKWRRKWWQVWMPKNPPPPPPPSFQDATIIPLATANFLSILTYAWISPLMTLGYQRPLQATDLWAMDDSRKSELLSSKLTAAWERRVRDAEEYNARIDRGEIRVTSAMRLKSKLLSWRSEDATGRKVASLAWALNDVFGIGFWAGGLFKVFGDTAQLMAPLLSKTIVRMIESPDPSIGRGVPMAIGLFLLTVTASLFQHQFFFRSMHTGVMARAALTTALYKRSLQLSPASRTTYPNGKLVNFLSTDISRIDYCAQWFHAGWTAPIQVSICLIILCVQLGPSALAGFCIFLILMPIQERAMSYQLGVRRKSMVWVDRRAKLLQELLGGMRVIKVFCYEIPFLERVTSIRHEELKGVWKISIIRAANQALAFSVPVLAAVLAFVTYSLTGHDLDPAIIFACMSLFQLLRQPLMFLPRALSAITDASNALERLRGVFMAETMDGALTIDPDLKWAVRVEHAEFRWETVFTGEQQEDKEGSKKGKKNKADRELKEKEKEVAKDGDKERPPDEPFALRDVNLSIPRGQLVAIVGPVGAGKSSLLQGLLGEMRRTKGTVTFGGAVGYCAQTAWIQNATLRENVLFGQSWDEDRYWKAIHDASLLADLEQLPDGDLTEIGEKGINLSGGQKQRVNIARALYYDADIVALDDPLSAVDAHVGRALFANAILGALKARGKTIILVTHALHFLPQVDYIYTFQDGVIAEQGTYDQLVASKGTFSRLAKQFAGEAEEQRRREELEEEREAEEGKPAEKKPELTTEAVRLKMEKIAVGTAAGTGKLEGRLIQAEKRKTGSVGRQVYGTYLSAGGGWTNSLMVLFLGCAMQACSVMATYWLVWWQENEFNKANGFYMGLYATLGVSQAFLTLAMGAGMTWLSYLASVRLHKEAVFKVFHAPMAFFDTTPLGRILGVLGKDIDTIDNLLTESLRMFAMTMSNVLGTIIIVTVVTHYFIVAVAVILLGYFYYFSYYTTSSRELKRLDASLRSLLYAHFAESLSGLVTIRAYQETPKFLSDNEYYTDLENRALLPTVVNQRWLAIRLDFLGALMILAVGLMAVVQVNGITPAQAGLVLSYMTSLTQAFSMMTRQSAEVENNMNAVERVVHYTADGYIAQEAAYRIPDRAPLANWPQHGAVKMETVRLRYRPGLDEVLKGVEWNVRAGEKVGVVGRTGAGKSSLLIALFRLVELSGGKITIDGLDIADMGLQDLRARLSIIPQDPLLFSGTIRSNLDPFGLYDDARLWDALRRSYLVESPALPVSSASSITAASLHEPTHEDTTTLLESKTDDPLESAASARSRFHLETVVDAEGSNLSVGERSLVSLARALVRDAKIIVLDEATASVDLETDEKIQKVIREDFKDRTLITIAHRLRTILSYDTILVMDNGMVAEHDTPLNLFLQEGSIFRGMCERSNITREEIERAKDA
ncbi:ABC protein [Dacryopinax primogenitus]|uniref:ABC protein n=1 Tax=Dacryopinax primogenitus (strain DJM 731) TaxID=1858805 RepID=M5G5F4_DACPD|nr:ABC protein [Dacryopinax primogenitus]EJU01052.1 ABC protein [Dacryopinax primogenitus]